MRRWVRIGGLFCGWALAQPFSAAFPSLMAKGRTPFSRAAQVCLAHGESRTFSSTSFLTYRDSLPNPRTALWLSALLPGAGQIYNRSYWKAPLIWGALALTGTLAYQNHKYYLRYRQAYRDALNGQNPFPTLSPENLRFLRETYRKDRDVFFLASLVVYALQIGEAYSDAHLKGFTIYAAGGPSYVRLVCTW